MADLEILYQDEYLVAVNKPSGLLVHRSWIDKDATEFAMQKVRDQIGQYVYPVHRLDRPTSGVLVMALSSDVARLISEKIENREVQKQYLALCRGFMPDSGEVDYELTEKLDKISDKNASKIPEPKSAYTRFETLDKSEISVLINRYPQSRFSLVRLFPREGRKHQIRRHLAHLRHPIIGDVNYGDNKYNHYFTDQYEASRLALHAEKLTLPHPITGDILTINAPLPTSFIDMASIANIKINMEK